MRATKGYLAVLGTSGLVTTTVVVLLVVGSGFAATGGAPDPRGTTSPLERVVVEAEAAAKRTGRPGSGIARRADRVARRAWS